MPKFEQLLGNGTRFGVNLQYVSQPRPEGIAQAFLVGEKFIGSACCALVLGDNIFYGHDLAKTVLLAGQQGVPERGCSRIRYRIRNVTESLSSILTARH